MNDALSQTIDQVMSRSAADGAGDRVVRELGAFVRLVAGSPRLAKALADPDASAESKRSLTNDLSGGTFHANTVEVLLAAANEKRKSPSAFVSLLSEVLGEAVFAVAEQKRKLEEVEQGLYSFALLVRESHELRDVLTNPAVDDEAKAAFVGDLLKGKADTAVVSLLQTLISINHGRDVDDGAFEFSRLAAERRDLVIAEVQTAIELDAERQRKLAAAIGRSIGKKVQPRFNVVPGLVGSVVVRVGDEVFDGSVRHRLDQARQALAGAQ